MPNLSLKGKVAIVTGGGTGIGRAIALEFAKAGADVVVASRRLAVLEEAAKEVRALGRRSLAVQTDTSRKADVDNLVQRTMDEFGNIDILVNNAGISVGRHRKGVGPVQCILEIPEEEWDRVIDIDLKGYFLCCQAAGKRMVEQRKGTIINVSSDGGVSTCGGASSPYNVAKAGVIMLTKGLAWELGPYNIRVNAIAPGPIKTPMTQRWSPEHEKWTAARRPLGRVAEPSEISTVALFLASEASSYVTGETIIVDGGRMA